MPDTPPAIPDHTLLHLIGRGSYGEVWLARNVMGTPRAVKIVRRASFETERPYEREFEGIRKCEPVSRSHEGLIDVLHMGRDNAAGFFYYVMELADAAGAGGNENEPWKRELAGSAARPLTAFSQIDSYRPLTLSVRLREGPLPAEDCLALAQSLAGALAHLHDHGLIHRDVKPSNILYVDSSPRLGDIGLVAEAGASRSFVGTEGYVPPEGPGSVKADLFALGKVLYEALTGMDRTKYPELPDNWAESGELDQRLELNEIVLRACEDNPQRRYSNARELLADAAAVAGGRSLQKQRAQEKRLRVARTIGFIAAGAALLAMGAFFFARRQALHERALRQRAETAEHAAQDARWQALCAHTRAARRDIAAGAVTAALAAAREAGAIRSSAALRSDAAFLLGRPDLTPYPVPALRDRVLEQCVLLDPDRRRWLHIPYGVDTAPPQRSGAPEWRSLDGGATVAFPDSFAAGHGWNFFFSGDFRWLADIHATTSVWDLESPGRRVELPQVVVNGEPQPTTKGEIIRARPPSDIVWFDAATGAEKRHVTVPGWTAQQISASDDGTAIVLLETGRGLACVEGESGALRWRIDMPRAIWPPVWSSDNARLFMLEGGASRVLNAATGTRRSAPAGIWELGGAEFCFAGSRHLLLSSSWGNVTWLHDVTRGVPLLRLPDAGRSLVFSARQKLFGLHEWSFYGARLYNWHPRAVLHILGSTGTQVTLAFTPDERRLASCERDACRWWSLDPVDDAAPQSVEKYDRLLSLLIHPVTGQATLFPPDQPVLSPPAPERPVPHPLRPGLAVEQAKQSADGTVRALCAGGEYAIWHGEERLPALPDGIRPESFAVSSDGRMVSAACYEGTGQVPFVLIWDIEAGKAPALRQRFDFPARRLAISPDGRWLSCAGVSETAVFDLTTFTEAARWPRRSAGAAGDTAFSADGKLILRQSSLEDFTLHRTGTWEHILTLNSPVEEQLILPVFSARGRWLAAAGARGEIYLWDLHALSARLIEMGLGWE